ncbi:MAG: leucine-rich repeat protein [Faecalibacterium sp.]|nr:leucine-rich repeat protein [Ruminococcus sp.]MCM1392044.1 leucine-rich repeat protein [Ruminococcus sp.]MCM1485821.1 leucine-rich repeat protein [Faecalibacterium sp.]
MKKTFKRTLLCLAIVVMFMSAVPVLSNIADIDLGVKASALSSYSYDLYDYETKTVEITGYRGVKSSVKKLDIPAKVDGKTVENISYNAFENFGNLTEVTIAEGITSIDLNAFIGCKKLTKVSIPKSVTYIGDFAFGYYYKNGEADLFEEPLAVSNLTIKGYTNSAADHYARVNGFKFESVGTVDPYVYSDVNVKSKTIEITHYYGSEKTVNIPSKIDGKTVVRIGESAFEFCDTITGITIPNTVKEIGMVAFMGCTGLKSLTIPETVEYVGIEAFYNCNALKSVTVKGNPQVGMRAFGWMSNPDFDLSNFGSINDLIAGAGADGALSILDSMHKKISGFTIKADKNTFVYRYAMNDGFKFVSTGEISPYVYEIVSAKDKTIKIVGYNGYDKTVKIPSKLNGYTVVGITGFDSCEVLTSVTIPNTVKTIDDYCFASCEKLTGVTIPSSVTLIGSDAFEGCSALTSIAIPKSVKTVSEFAFSECSKLKSVTIADGVKEIGDDAFLDTALKSVTIPASVKTIGEEAFGYTYDTESGKVSGFTITGTYNSAAHKYAKANGFKFVDSCKHTYGEWKTTKKATTSSTGTQTRTCSKCKKTETKTIAKLKMVELKKCTITVKATAAYTGKEVKPTVTVKNGKTTLKLGTHYKVTYKNNKNMGTATVTVKGIEKYGYKGTKTLTFKIVPANVKNLKATQTTSSVKLTWSAVTGAKGYRVFKYDTAKKAYVKVADTTKTTYTFSKLKAGTGYKYAVQAYAKNGKTTYLSASKTTISTATKTAAPTLKVTAGSKKADLSWNKVSGASGYVVYMSTSKSGDFKKIATIKNGALKYSKTGLKKGTTYYFKVTAYKTAGGTNIYSAASAVKSVKVK